VGGRTGDTGQRYSSSADDVRQKFTGYQKDIETNLDFAEARMYENRYGRFTAVDPLITSGRSANPQTFNRYVYVGNSPLRRVDPAGEDWWDVTDKAGTRHIAWFDEDPDEELFDINDRWEKYLYQASDSQWYALNPDGPESQGFSEYERARWQYGNYVNFDGAYEGIAYDMFSANDMAHMVAGMKTGNIDDSLYYFGKISLENGLGSGLGKFICGRSSATSTLGLDTAEAAARNTVTSMVPLAAQSLGKWGETRLAQVLGNAGEKPAKAMATSLGNRFVDRIVNKIAHEAKAGLNVGLTSTIRKQILKDAELISTGQIKGAQWHFFRGAQQEVLDFLTLNGIKYTVY
jgi:RHS repeat-associated protein